MKSLKPFLFILLAAVLLGGGGIALYYYNTSQSPQVAPPVTTEKPEKTEVAKKEVPDTQLPEGFPINLPIESGAQITQNFTVTTPDGRTQSTRGYVSTKSLADSYKTFTDYLKKEGWIITAEVDQPKLKVLSATAGGKNIKIDMTESADGQKTISISLISPKKVK